jgi:hypothetical protein
VEPTSTPDDAPTTEFVAAGVGDRCSNCQTPLASDQRYCVNCGERRGKSRFAFDATNAQTASAAPPKKPTHRPHVSSSFGFIAGVATLLLAMGVGVLIGHDTGKSAKTTEAAAPSQVIKIEGGGGSGGNSSTKSASKKAIKSEFKAPTVHLTKKVAKAVQSAAANTLGSQGVKNLSNNPTQAVGGSCSGGAGCQNHKFTGNYFP